MLKNHSRTRVRKTGMYGEIVGWRQGEERCEVAIDDWQCQKPPDGIWQPPCTYEMKDLEELIKVRRSERTAVLDNFDTLVITSWHSMCILDGTTIVIKREGDSVDVLMQSWDHKTDERKTIVGTEATKVASSALATRTDKWIKPFEPKDIVMDGYSWTMVVYSGNRYFTCEGDNAAPDELVDLLYTIADIGMPLAWNGYEISLPADDDAVRE